jgi:hypothetical protein
VLPNDALRPAPTFGREHDAAAAALDIVLGLQPAHHLRHRLGAVAEPFHEPRLDHDRALLLEGVDGLEILLERWMEAIGHCG